MFRAEGNINGKNIYFSTGGFSDEGRGLSQRADAPSGAVSETSPVDVGIATSKVK